MSEPYPSQPAQSEHRDQNSAQHSTTSDQNSQMPPAGHMQQIPDDQHHQATQSVQHVQPAQPQFGQLRQPEYGQMAAAYPGYNPYIYGAPEEKSKKQSVQQHAEQEQHYRMSQPFGALKHRQGAHTHSAQSQQQVQRSDRRPSVADHLPFNPDDPKENPVYGSWDVAAIIAFICAIFAIPIVPLVLGGIAIYRDKILHLRGRGLAIAAVVLSLISTAFSIYFVISGVDPMQFILNLYGIDPSSLIGADTTQA